MGSSAKTEYCAFTKAVEHLGDRWSLLIVRELVQFGPQGFNTLASGLPGHVSRSVLATKLRKLEALGIVSRNGDGSRQAPYRLAPAGEQLIPTLKSLWNWAERWVPEDPAMAERDPTVIAYWLLQRVNRAALPPRPTVVEISIRDARETRSWLRLEAGAEPELCADDPQLDESRYVYVEAGGAALMPIARGERPWNDALRVQSVQLYGDPELVAALPTWFMPAPVSDALSA